MADEKRFTALQLSDQRVVAAAQRHNWRPATFVARVEKALPALTSQAMYMELAGETSLRPETFRDVLAIWLGDDELNERDFVEQPVGQHLVSARAQPIVERLEALIELLIDPDTKLEGTINRKLLAELVGAYSSETKALIESIWDNLEEVAVKLKLRERLTEDADDICRPRRRGDGKRIYRVRNHTVFWRACQTALDWARDSGDLNTDILEILEALEEQDPGVTFIHRLSLEEVDND